MISFPNCKINLGLNITAKRNDGFHDLETIFIPINLKDIIEVIHADNSTEPLQYSSSGIPVDTDPSGNLCVRAYHLLKKDFPQIPSVKFHLLKAIPTGAGLGGGSADAAFTLKLLNTKFNLGLSTEHLMAYALQLGSDCSFFIYNKPCFATGRGEVTKPFDVNLSPYKFLIVHPGIHISTAQAFSQLTPSIPAISIIEAITRPIQAWKELIKNDFEVPAFKNFPEIQEIKNELYKLGAIYASLSGSGSTVYGIFEKNKKVNHSFPKQYFIKEILSV